MNNNTNVKATDAEVIAKFNELLSQVEVSKYFGYKSSSHIQKILVRNGIDTKKLKEEARFKLYKEYRNQDMTYDQIARLEGLSKERVEDYCNDNGLGYTEEERKRERAKGGFKPSVDWQERVDWYYGGHKANVIQASRRSDGELTITVKCCTCETICNVSSTTLRPNKKPGQGRCEVCHKRRRRNELLDQQEARRREKRHNRKIMQLAFPMCTKCGMLVPKGHSVCEECKKQTNRELWRKADIVRRSRLDDVIKDKDITLKKLYERDNGVCYICGNVCDWNDSEWKDGVFIVGRNYPTIEHLKPLSQGGSHTWNNIRLACLSCNSKKGSREAV